MIRIGAYTGVGFGNSSPQKAGIALNTVQADSTYAFYIASEHGAWGGVFLLLLAALPLALVAWRHWRASGASWLTELLYIIAGAFFLETLAQVLMNSMQIIPFTGRNLPLLSVSSLSDVLRWSVLFSCAVLIMVADRDPQDEAVGEELALEGQGGGGRCLDRLRFANPHPHPGPSGGSDARKPEAGRAKSRWARYRPSTTVTLKCAAKWSRSAASSSSNPPRIASCSISPRNENKNRDTQLAAGN